VPRKARAASAAASSESLAASTSASGSGAGVVDSGSGCRSSLLVRSSRSSLMPLLLRDCRCRRRHGLVQDQAVDDIREDLVGTQDVGGHDRRDRSEEHTSELQSPYDLVCRLLLEKKKSL